MIDSKNIKIKLEEKLGEERVWENEVLANHCTWRVGGPAQFWFEAKTLDEVVQAVSLAKKLSLPYFILGGGSNTLFSDKGFLGLVIKNSTNGIKVLGITGKIKSGNSQQTAYVEADAGATFNRLVRFTLDEGFSGFEDFLGQPGTVGGAIFINAHFPKEKKFVGDFLVKAKLLTKAGEVKEADNNYFQFGYDQSVIQKNGDIVLSAVFKLERSQKDKVWPEGDKAIAYRQISQPQGYPTAGCTFRNISSVDALIAKTPNESLSAGFLIDQCGLKGAVSGGAQISDKHANFIINKDKAKAGDIVNLINLCKNKVKEKFGVDLKEEVVYCGEFDG